MPDKIKQFQETLAFSCSGLTGDIKLENGERSPPRLNLVKFHPDTRPAAHTRYTTLKGQSVIFISILPLFHILCNGDVHYALSGRRLIS